MGSRSGPSDGGGVAGRYTLGHIRQLGKVLRIGAWWVHLRLCTSGGHVGCCDDPPNRHASARFRATGHPIIQSCVLGEGVSALASQ